MVVADGLEDLDLGEDLLGFPFGEMVEPQLIPGDLVSFFEVAGTVDEFVGALAEDLIAALEPIGRVCLKRRLVLGVFKVALGSRYCHG